MTAVTEEFSTGFSTGETAGTAATLVEALLLRASGPGAALPLFTALDGGGERVQQLTPAELDLRARVLAAALREVGGPGDRVIVPTLPGLDFHVGFLGCLYAGMIAVPVPVFRQVTHTAATTRADRLTAICRDAEPCAVLVSTVEEAAQADPGLLPGVSWTAVRRPLPEDATALPGAAFPDPLALDPTTTALLQYTSGSTREPRGVIVSHGNLIANQLAMGGRCEVDAATTVVSWLPLFHDMGLCTALVLPLVTGARAVNMAPATFVRDPRVWLRAIEAEEDVFAAAPDFAYEMCVKRVPAAERAAIDLSTWRVAANGSEPVRAATQRRFADAFRASFFREEVFSPGYGLAECTLSVTMGRPLYATPTGHYDRASLAEGKAVPVPASPDSVELVGCGSTVAATRILVVDPVTRRPLAERVVGEIWVDAPGNCAGYWRRDEESAEIFGARTEDGEARRETGTGLTPTGPTYVRTGDLGFLEGDELYITGRLKDLLIVGGENYFPQDLEAVASEAHPAFFHQRAAAWPFGEDGRGVAVVVETIERDPEVLAAAVRAAGIAVAKAVPTTVNVYAVSRNRIPRTTSGKIRRQVCAQEVLSGRLPVVARWPAN